MQVVHLPELDAMAQRFAVMKMQPLKITLRTLKPVAGNDALHLDGLLAKAVVIEAMKGAPLADTKDAYWLPVPLALERTHLGLPAWQCNDFQAIDKAVGHTHYHQRTDANPYDMPVTKATLSTKKKRRMPPTSEGQYMSYRIPLQYTDADRWDCDCVGNREEILRLLSYISFVGKKSSQGFGRVLSWEAEPISSFSMTRPTPISDAREPFNASVMGWTPPYWHRGLWRLCA